MNSGLTPDTASELAGLRAEVVELRRDLDRALERLDLPHSKDRREGDSEWANMEFEQVNVRHSGTHIPVMLYTDTDEGGIYLYDARQRVRGRFVIGSDGMARLEILNAEGKVAVSIGEEDGGRGGLRANDADCATRAGIKAGTLGGVLTVVNPQGQTLAAVMSTEEGGLIYVCTPASKAVMTLKSLPEGGALFLYEPSGQVMGSFTVTSSGAVLSVYGEHGAPALALSGLGEPGGTLVFYTREGDTKGMLP